MTYQEMYDAAKLADLLVVALEERLDNLGVESPELDKIGAILGAAMRKIVESDALVKAW